MRKMRTKLTILICIIVSLLLIITISPIFIQGTNKHLASIWAGDFSGSFLLDINNDFEYEKYEKDIIPNEGSNINYSGSKILSVPTIYPDENGDLFIWLNYIDSEFNLIDKEKIIRYSDFDDIYDEEKNFQSFNTTQHHELKVNEDYSQLLISSFLDPDFAGATDDDKVVFYQNKDKETQHNVEQVSIQDILSIKDNQIYDNGSYNLNSMDIQEKFPERRSIDFIHANAFDINPKTNRLFISSRTLGMIIIVDIEDLKNPKLEMILSNPIVYNFMEDDGINNPIVKYDGSNKFNWAGYMSNDNYKPHIKKEWKGKTLDYIVNGEKYSSEEYYWDLSEEYIFMGQHYVRSLNSFIEETNLIDDYNPKHEYISIFDNHSAQDNPYQFHWVNGVAGANRYDLDNDGKWDKGALSVYDNAPTIEEDTSYFKLIDIDPDNMTARLVSNIEIPYSSYISNAQIYQINNQFYLYTHSGLSQENDYHSLDKIFSFDSINSNYNANASMINIKEIFNYKYNFASYRGALIPDSNFIWTTIDNL